MFLKIRVLKNFGYFTKENLKLYKKEIPTQEFSREICEIFKNIFFYRTPLVAASECLRFHKMKPASLQNCSLYLWKFGFVL